jgi:hypothetical protein
MYIYCVNAQSPPQHNLAAALTLLDVALLRREFRVPTIGSVRARLELLIAAPLQRSAQPHP